MESVFFALISPACAIPIAGVYSITKVIANSINAVSPESILPSGVAQFVIKYVFQSNNI